MIEQVQEQVSVPKSADGLAKAVADLAKQLVADHKAAGGSLPVELSTDAIALVKDLQSGLAAAGGIGAELAEAPIGVAEAFTLAGFDVARSLTGK